MKKSVELTGRIDDIWTAEDAEGTIVQRVYVLVDDPFRDGEHAVLFTAPPGVTFEKKKPVKITMEQG